MTHRPNSPFIRARRASASLACLLAAGGVAFIPTATAQPAPYVVPYGENITALTRSDDQLSGMLAFHGSTTLGAQDIAALTAIGARVCYVDADVVQDAFSAFTRRPLCSGDAADTRAGPYRIVINRDRTIAEIAAAATAFSVGVAEPDNRTIARTRYEQQMWPVLLSLYMANESSTALQVQAGVIDGQARLLDARQWRDYATVDIASEIASDARMVLQASNLVHEQGVPLNIVVRMLNVMFPNGEGGRLLQMYEQGRDQPGYDPAANMERAMARLWNPTSGNATTRARVAGYWQRAYQPGEPETASAAPISRGARRTVLLAADSSGVANFGEPLVRLASAVANASRADLGLPARPADATGPTGLRLRIR